jgi:hypothetical protein
MEIETTSMSTKQLNLLAPARVAPSTFANVPSVFLAGSIDAGAAEEWQARMTARLMDKLNSVAVFNPRRPTWDDTITCDISDPNFRDQVEWELEHLAAADVIAMYFDPNGKAPITLLELGLHAEKHNVVICCPPGYWRRGNVQIIAERFGLSIHDNYEDFFQDVYEELLAAAAAKNT